MTSREIDPNLLTDSRIDTKIKHEVRKSFRDDGTMQTKPESGLYSMLVRAKDELWNYQVLPEVEFIAQLGDIFAIRGTYNTLCAMVNDTNVISVQGESHDIENDY